MSIRVDWTNYDAWRKLWDGWVKALGENKVIMQQIQFLDLYNHFVRRVKATREARPDFDVYTVDVESFIDPKLTYEENKLILDKMLLAPPTERDYKSMSEEYVNEAIKDVEAHYPEVVEHFRQRIKEMESEAAREPSKDRERLKFKRLSTDLAAELEETKKQLEEAKKKPAEFIAFKIRILQPFSEGIMKYSAGDIVETKNVDWAIEKIEKGLAERVGRAPPVEKPAERPPAARPTVKPMAAIPDTCPVDQTALEEVTKIPLILRKKPELTSQEEWLRSTMGVPIPSFETQWLDVPPTMKVWMCGGNRLGLETHYYERDATTGKLTPRTPEFIYRKLIRETAALRRLVAPVTPMPPELRPIYRRGYEWVPPKPTVQLKPPALSFWDWIQQTPRNLTKLAYMNLEDVERKFLLDEYTRLCREAARK